MAYPVYRYDTYNYTDNYSGYNGSFEIDQQLDQFALNQIVSGPLPFYLRQMSGDLNFDYAELTFAYDPAQTLTYLDFFRVEYPAHVLLAHLLKLLDLSLAVALNLSLRYPGVSFCQHRRFY
jgi:hypothetical protein